MKFFATLATILGVAAANPQQLVYHHPGAYPAMVGQPLVYHAMPTIQHQVVVPAAPAAAASAAVPRPQLTTVQGQRPVEPAIKAEAYKGQNLDEARATGVSKQYHKQDELGNYAYGYVNQNSEKHEAGNSQLGVKGHYTYVDGNGLNRRVDYVADNQGFRASGDDVRRPIKRDADADPSVMMTAAVMTSGPVVDNRHGYLLNNLNSVQPSRSVMYMMDGDSGILLSSDRLVDMSRLGMDSMSNLGMYSGMLDSSDNMRLRQDLTVYDMINGGINQNGIQRTIIPQMRNVFLN